MDGMRTWRLLSVIALMSLLIVALAACGGNGATTTTGQTATTQAGAAGAATTAATTTTAAGTTTASAATMTTTTAPTTAGSGAAPATTAATTTAGGPATPVTSGTPTTGATGASGIAGNATRYTILPDASKATYRVDETLAGVGFTTAEGSTSAVSGDIFIDRQRPSASRIGTITIDISKLESDSGRRDAAIRSRWLESSKYPTATFVPKRLEGLPDTPYTEGQELKFKIVGDLTIRNVTKEVTFDTTGRIDGDTFKGTANTQFNMTDFGFDPPEILNFVKAENGVKLELAIEAKRAQ